MKALRVPLHLNPRDHSPEAEEARIFLHMDAAALMRNRGFRTPSSRNGATKKKHNVISWVEIAARRAGFYQEVIDG